MKTKLIAMALLLGVLLVLPAGAQQPEPKPEFDNAPVTDVLRWAQDSIGVGFIYDAAVLTDPGTNQLRRVTARQAQPATSAEKTLLLFELLKRCGLVAFVVGGLPGPTYQLYAADGASRAADIALSVDELDGRYFGALSIRLQAASVQSVAPRIRERLTPGVGSLEVFEATHTMVITDFTDRLLAAWEIAMAADLATIRDDDLVVFDFAAINTPAEKLATALERVRGDGESWKLTVNDTANVLLISGRRDEAEAVLERLDALDSHKANPAFAENTQTIKLVFLQPAEAAKTLREMFEVQVKVGSVQIGAFERDRKIVFKGSEYDFQRAKATIAAIDVQAEPK